MKTDFLVCRASHLLRRIKQIILFETVVLSCVYITNSVYCIVSRFNSVRHENRNKLIHKQPYINVLCIDTICALSFQSQKKTIQTFMYRCLCTVYDYSDFTDVCVDVSLLATHNITSEEKIVEKLYNECEITTTNATYIQISH